MCFGGTAVNANGTIGEVLREIRKESGLTLPRIAELSGLSSSAICAYERGARGVSLDGLYRLARTYDVDPLLLVSVMERRVQLSAAS